MFIKEVVLCGFKSYKETTRIEDFNPGYNVIVGRNGSGKSNFLAALEFALRSESLKPEERNALLYHGQVSNNIAYVEVVFDNTDRKLPYNTDTVVFRRVIGAKKDRFYVNKKESNNIKQFLDSAGVTNPYYIVRQGKINEMASANENIRLQVLYDVSGSKIYDEKKTQGHKMLEECRMKFEDVDNLIESIDQHLETMEEGSKELQKYFKLEKKKRALEYVVECREKITIASKIEKLQMEHSELVASCEPLQKCVSDLKSKMDLIDGKIITMEQQVVYLEFKKRDIESEIPLTSFRIAVVENEAKDALQIYKRSLHSEKNITKITKTLVSTIDELEKLNESIVEIKNREAISVDEYALCKTNMETYKEKYGRIIQFATKSERDSWIEVEISKLDENLVRQKTLLKNHSEVRAKVEDDINELTELLEHEKQNWEINRVKLIDKEPAFDNNIFLEKQKKMWNDASKIDQQLNSAKENITRLTDLLRKNGGNAYVTGWNSLQSILRDLRQDKYLEQTLKGYYGIVLENFSCHESRNVAVEVTAGSKLFYHIVENHQVSKAIMAEFNRRKLSGEISFISIADMTVEDRHYPENPQEGIPLIEEITFDEKVRKAMKYVFGGTMLCTSLELATQNAKRFKINCVTTEGDKVLNRGPVTGGYYNRRMSKIDVMNKLRNENCVLENLNNEKKVLDEKLLLVEKDIIACAKNNAEVNLSADEIRSTFENIQLLKDNCERKLNDTQLKLKHEERIIETLNNNIKTLTLKRVNLDEELNEAMSEKSSQYAQQMERFQMDVTKILKCLQDISSERKEKESLRKNLEKSVVKMEKEVEELKIEVIEGRSTSLEKSKSGLEKQLDSLCEVKRKLDRDWNDTSTEYSAHQEKVHGLRLEKDKIYEVMSRKKAEIDIINKKLQQIFSSRSDNQRILAEIIGTIRRLGTIPSDVGMYENKSSKELCRQLKSTSKSLKSLGKVNKKATEKLERATKVKEELLEEKGKYNAINAKIVELDKILDDKKGEAVFKAFQTIHQQFKEIFLKLVPHGNIRMFLRTKNGGQVTPATVIDGKDGKAILGLFRENKFEGLAIDVNFLGKSLKDTRDLRSLSGGQKSLISLALLLAIQRCDPVPLYIFDEVDQALDRKHRSAVAAVIKELSQNAQFICTTFSRQFVDKSDAAFGVFFRNQTSKILPISVDQALSFVKNEPQTSSDDSNFENSSCENSQVKQNKDGPNATTVLFEVNKSIRSNQFEDEDEMDIN